MDKIILLIDDDEEEMLILSEALKEIGSRVKCVSAATAEEGIRMVQQLLPDFVFLDINMPVFNGLECLDIIKKNKSINEIPVIIYSTGINESIKNTAIQKGAVACIKKGDSIKELVNVLKKVLFQDV